jgi:DNA-binding NarL/FixJ family response regulator
MTYEELEYLLTRRELQIVELVCDGHPSKVIAYELKISIRTVENHRARIMDKLNCGNVVQLVLVYLEETGKLR